MRTFIFIVVLFGAAVSASGWNPSAVPAARRQRSVDRSGSALRQLAKRQDHRFPCRRDRGASHGALGFRGRVHRTLRGGRSAPLRRWRHGHRAERDRPDRCGEGAAGRVPDAARSSVALSAARAASPAALARSLRGERSSWPYFWPLSLMSVGQGVTTNASSALLPCPHRPRRSSPRSGRRTRRIARTRVAAELVVR